MRKFCVKSKSLIIIIVILWLIGITYICGLSDWSVNTTQMPRNDYNDSNIEINAVLDYWHYDDVLDPFAEFFLDDYYKYFNPTFADLDNDSMEEFIIGFYSSSDIHQVCLKNYGNRENPIWKRVDYLRGIINDSNTPAFTFADLDNDSLLDCITGMYYGELYIYRNNGTATKPSWERMPSWEKYFPSDFGYHVRPVLTDIDNDSDYDCMISYHISYDNCKIALYINNGTQNNPSWTFKENIVSFTQWYDQEPRIAMADIDNDKDQDILIGFATYQSFGGWGYEFRSNFKLLRNIGNSTHYNFTWANSLVSNLLVGESGSPAFIDWDKDGDYDIVAGDHQYLHYFENINNETHPIWKRNGPELINKGIIPGNLQMDIADINFDGKKDIIVFRNIFSLGDHIIQVFLNFGTESAPFFVREPIYQITPYTLQSVYSRFEDGTAGDIDNDSKIEIICRYVDASSKTKWAIIENVGTNENPDWELNETFFDSYTILGYGPDIVDLNNDSLLDFVTLNSDGSINFYQNNGTDKNPSWTLNTTYFSGTYISGTPTDISFGDLNYDSKLDFVIVDDNVHQVYRNAGSIKNPSWVLDNNIFCSSPSNLNYKSYIDFSDLNNDGYIDFIGDRADEGRFYVLYYSSPYKTSITPLDGQGLGYKSNPTFNISFYADAGIDDGFMRFDKFLWKIIFENSTQTDQTISQQLLNSTEWNNLVEGKTYYIYLGITDDNGIFEGKKLNRYISFYKDISPPIFPSTYLDQINNSIFNLGTDQVHIVISDNYSYIGDCYSQLDATGWDKIEEGIINDKTYSAWKTIDDLISPSFDTISEGLHKLYFWITDRPGNSQGSDLSLWVNIYKDSIDPFLYQDPLTRVDHPQTLKNGNKVWVNGTSTDNGSLIYNSGINQTSIISSNATGVLWENGGNATHWAFYNTTNIADGRYFLIIQATDNGGNSKNLTCNITIDTKPPSASQSNKTLTPQKPIEGKIWINGTAIDDGSGLKNIEIASCNASGVAWSANQGTLSNWAFYNTSNIADGNYQMILNITDNAGFWTLYKCNFTVDSTLPIITIFSPENNTIYGDILIINVSVIDIHLNVTKFYYFDGVWKFIGENNSKSEYITYSWNLTGIDLDNTTILVNATDIAGNFKVKTTANSVSLDGLSPIITLISPSNGEIITSLSYLLNVTTTSNDICNITFYYHDGIGWNFIGINTTKFSDEFTFNWSIINFDLENVSVLINATDHVGHYTTYQTTNTIKIDNIYPNPSINNPNSDVNISGVYILNVSVIDNDVLTVQFYYHNGSAWIFIGTNSTHPRSHVFTYEWNTSSIDLDSITIMFNLTDDVGHVSSITTAGLNIKVDNVIPTVNLLSPLNNEKITGIYLLKARVFDLDIHRVAFYYYDSGWIMIGTNTTIGLQEYTLPWDTTGLNLYNIQIRVNATDDFGYTGTNTTSASIEIDNTAPVINLINPSDGEIIVAVYTLLATTTHLDVQTVEFYYYNTTWHLIGINNTNSNGDSFTFIWDTTLLDLNNTMIRVNATDDVGLIGTYTTTASIKIDNSPPQGAQDPKTMSDNCQNNKNIWINGTASDLVQLNSVEIYSESASTTNLSGVIWSTNLGNNTHWAFRNLTNIPDGYWWIKIKISDISGKYINFTAYIWVDTHNPVLLQAVSTKYPNVGQNIKPYWVNGTYSDGTPLKNISVKAFNGSGITWNGIIVNETHWAFYSNDNILDGIYNVSIIAFDKSNKSAVVHCIILLDFTIPNITLNSIKNNTLTAKPKTLDFTIQDKFIDYVEWRSSLTDWSTNFIGTYDIDLCNFSCNNEYDFEIRVFDKAGNQNYSKYRIRFNRRTLVSDNTIINALVDDVWIDIQTTESGYVEVEKLTYNPFSEYSLPATSVNLFYRISTNLTTFISEIRIYLNDTTNLKLFYWDEVNLEWKEYTQSGSKDAKSTGHYLWANTNKLGYITVLEIPSGTSSPADFNWIILLVLIIIIGGISAGMAYYLSKKRIKTVKPKTKTKPKVMLKKDIPIDVKVLRGGEIKGKSYVYKVKVVNESEFNLTDISVQIVSYPYDCLKLTSKEIQKVNKLDAGGFVSPTFTFQPTHDCVKGKILANVSFVDMFNNLHTIEVKPHEISMVCGLFKPIKISNEEFSKITSGLLDFTKAGDEFKLPYNPMLIFSKLSVLLPENNFEIINEDKREIGETFFGIIRGFAEGKFSKKKIGVEITISGDKFADESMCKIEAFSEDQFVLPPLISELNEGLQTWNCINCNAPLTEEQVDLLLASKAITCKSCGNVMTKMIPETSPNIEIFEEIRRELLELKARQEQIIATQELTLTKIEEINEYVLDMMKLIPLPSKIESMGKVRKTIKIYFTCPVDDELVGVIEEKSWAQWVKFVTAIGQAALDYVPGISVVKDLIKTASNIYSQFSGGKSLPKDVVMLTTQEREGLRKILIKAGILDKMKYCPKCKRWVCNKHFTEKRCCEECSL